MLSAIIALAVPALRVAIPAVASYVAHRAADKAVKQALPPPGRRPDSITGTPPNMPPPS